MGAVAYWQGLADDEVSETEADKTKAARCLKASLTTSGVIDIQGRLDPIGGEIATPSQRSPRLPLHRTRLQHLRGTVPSKVNPMA